MLAFFCILAPAALLTLARTRLPEKFTARKKFSFLDIAVFYLIAVIVSNGAVSLILKIRHDVWFDMGTLAQMLNKPTSFPVKYALLSVFICFVVLIAELCFRMNINIDAAIDALQKAWAVNRKAFTVCLTAAFLWGLFAHAYIFLHSSFSHDSLNEFNAAVTGNSWKIQLGRVFVPAYRIMTRSVLSLPWLIGLLSLFYIGISVFLTVKIFDINSTFLMLLTAGIFSVNITVIATAGTYIHDLDCDMLALLFSVFAVYLWKNTKKGFLVGGIPIALSLGLYQSYLSTTITLILFDLILLLLNDGKWKAFFANCVRAVGMLVCGAVLYLCSIKGICFITGLSLAQGGYNTLDRGLSMSFSEWVNNFIKGYRATISHIFNCESVYSDHFNLTVHILIAVMICAITLIRLITMQGNTVKKLLLLALFAVLPWGMNISYMLSNGTDHDLMHFALWLFYLLPLLLASHIKEYIKPAKNCFRQCAPLVSIALVFVILWGNVQTANTIYLKKDLISQATQSLFTRIISDIEDTEGYVMGETPIVFVGNPSRLLNTIPGFEDISVTGSSYTHALGVIGISRYRTYFNYIMAYPGLIADTTTWNEMTENEAVASMPCYPSEGSIQMIDGVLVVKLSEL